MDKPRDILLHLINGQAQGHLTPSGGIRQWDPLSPYLFILCAEGLSNLMKRAEMHNVITGQPISRGGTKLSHLFFANDSLLFCKARFSEWTKIQKLLTVYEKASGQKINRAKTSIFFSKNTKAGTHEHILAISGVSASSSYEKYLGLPSLVGQSKTCSFKSIQDRIWNRIYGWKEKFLL